MLWITKRVSSALSLKCVKSSHASKLKLQWTLNLSLRPRPLIEHFLIVRCNRKIRHAEWIGRLMRLFWSYVGARDSESEFCFRLENTDIFHAMMLRKVKIRSLFVVYCFGLKRILSYAFRVHNSIWLKVSWSKMFSMRPAKNCGQRKIASSEKLRSDRWAIRKLPF